MWQRRQFRGVPAFVCVRCLYCCFWSPASANYAYSEFYWMNLFFSSHVDVLCVKRSANRCAIQNQFQEDGKRTRFPYYSGSVCVCVCVDSAFRRRNKIECDMRTRKRWENAANETWHSNWNFATGNDSTTATKTNKKTEKNEKETFEPDAIKSAERTNCACWCFDVNAKLERIRNSWRNVFEIISFGEKKTKMQHNHSWNRKTKSRTNSSIERLERKKKWTKNKSQHSKFTEINFSSAAQRWIGLLLLLLLLF